MTQEYRPDLDSTRVMKLGLFHEIGQIYAGEVTPTDDISQDEKTQKEYQGIQHVFSRLPNKIHLYLGRI
ncbi:MAG: HD domain-containing protein [Nanobdellota archaeon]